jgi:hypothetical protein
LLCIECNEPVILKAGAKIPPYFAHAPGSESPNCIYRIPKINKVKHKALQLTYNYFKYFNHQTEKWNFHFDYPVSDDLRSDMYIEDKKLHYMFVNLQKRSDIFDIKSKCKSRGIKNLRFIFYSVNNDVVKQFSHHYIRAFYQDFLDGNIRDAEYEHYEFFKVIDVNNEKIAFLAYVDKSTNPKTEFFPELFINYFEPINVIEDIYKLKGILWTHGSYKIFPTNYET